VITEKHVPTGALKKAGHGAEQRFHKTRFFKVVLAKLCFKMSDMRQWCFSCFVNIPHFLKIFEQLRGVDFNSSLSSKTGCAIIAPSENCWWLLYFSLSKSEEKQKR